MRKILSFALISAIGLSAGAANAQYRGWHRVERPNGGAVAAAGLLGFVAGAVVTSENQQPSYYAQPQPYYGQQQVVVVQQAQPYYNSQPGYGIPPGARVFVSIPGGFTQVYNSQQASQMALYCDRPAETVFGGVQIHCQPR